MSEKTAPLSLLDRLGKLVLRYAGLVALVGTALGGVGGYYSTKLYKNLRTNFEELLPTNARSVLDMEEVTHRLESIDNLAVLVFSKDTQASKRFVDDLAGRLSLAPKSTIASVEYRVDRELKFFKDRSALYMELSDLRRIRDYVRDRIEYEKQLYNPLNIFSEVEIPEPILDFSGLQGKYETRTGSYGKFPDGYYATPDQTKRVVLVYAPGKTSGGERIHRLKNFVLTSVQELNPKTYAPDLEVRYAGGIQNTIEEQAALVADLELSTIIVMILVTLVLWLFFRTFRITLALMASLIVGTLWTFGAAYFAVGYLNANSAFLGSIVLGNGINFGIIFLARYQEERRNGRSHHDAVLIGITQTATATWTAALAAGLSYGSLMLTGFRGFNQFGTIGLIGMVLCWISAFTVLPAYLTLLDRMKSFTPERADRQKHLLADSSARFISNQPVTILTFSAILTVLSLLALARYNPEIIEADLSKLRNKQSMESGSGYLAKYVNEIFQRYLSPMVILPRSIEDTPKIAEALRAKKAAEGPKSPIASVQTMAQFIPRDQSKKIETLHEITRLLPPRIMTHLSDHDKKLLKQYLNPTVFTPVSETDLPSLVLNRFREKDGTVGKMVLVEPPLTDVTKDRHELARFVRILRETADSVAPGTPVAGTLAVSSDMFESISRDGPRATLFAFLAVVALVIVLFRSPGTIALVLFSLILGMTWLTGMILGFQLKINFLNFIALPITFGIGVDYGVNVFQRYRQEGAGSIERVIRETGGPVGLCSLTTILGYGSLLIAQNQAFVSFGLLAVLGEITCLIAAVFTLPALLLVSSRVRGGSPQEDI